MTVPAYVDVSHFRAPYKNAYFSGYGDDPGTPPPPPPAPPPAPVPYETTKGSDGFRRLTPQSLGTVMSLLAQYRVIQQGNFGKLISFTPTEVETGSEQVLAAMSGAGWLKAQAAEKRAVFIGDSTVLALFDNGAPPKAQLLPGGSDFMMFFAEGDPKIQEGKKAGGAILLTGGGEKPPVTEKAGLIFGLSPLEVAGVAAVVVGAFYLYNRKSKSKSPSYSTAMTLR